MKVVNDRGMKRTHTVNDKAVISHGVEAKQALSKKQGGKLETKMSRSVNGDNNRRQNEDNRKYDRYKGNHKGGGHNKGNNFNNRSSINNTSRSISSGAARAAPKAPEMQKRQLSEKQKAFTEQKKTHNAPKSVTEKVSVSKDGSENRTVNNARSVSKIQKDKAVEKQLTRSLNKSVIPQKPQLAPTASETHRQRFANRQLRMSPHKKYLVLKNGTVDKNGLSKKMTRTIYNKMPPKMRNERLKHIYRKITNVNRTNPVVNTAEKPKIDPVVAKEVNKVKKKIAGVDKAQKVVSETTKNAQKALNKGGMPDLRSFSSLTKASPIGAVSTVITKPVGAAKQKLLSQRPNVSKTDDTGTEAVKFGLQTADYGERGVKTAVNTGKKAVDKTRKLAKQVERRINKSTSKSMRRGLQKKVVRNSVTKRAGKAAKSAVKKTIKAVEKPARKAAVNAAKKAAQSAYKAAQVAVKAVSAAVAKVAGLIASTMPYSLIVIGAIVLILLIFIMFGSMFGSIGGSVGGSGSWLVDDNTIQTPEEIYEGYKQFIEQAKEVVDTQVKDTLKGTVTAFCESDTATPRKMIEYHDKNNSRFFYPANGADTTINALIDQFGYDEYADYLSLLFVLMTREKQQADGGQDGDIYDFDFTKEDFEEFIKTVNENTCRWGQTFMVKTAVETTGNACPGENCRVKYISGCQCGSYTDDNGNVHHFCKGHPYCEHDHTKLSVNLYTIKDYYNMDYDSIYNFTDNEKARYEASKLIIQSMLDYWEVH